MSVDDQKPEPDLPALSPPARLHRVLIEMVREKLDSLQAGHVIAEAMQEKPAELPGVWSVAHAGLLHLLADAKWYVRDAIPSFDGSPHEETFKDLDNLLASVITNEKWANYRPRFDPLVRIALRFSVHIVAPAPPRMIPREDVTTIRHGLSNLKEAVIASAWPVDFKAEVIEALGNLDDRLVRFTIFGPEGVRKATAEIVGTLITNEPSAQSNPALVKQAADLLTKVADVFLKYYAIGQIGGTILRQLGSGT